MTCCMKRALVCLKETKLWVPVQVPDDSNLAGINVKKMDMDSQLSTEETENSTQASADIQDVFDGNFSVNPSGKVVKRKNGNSNGEEREKDQNVITPKEIAVILNWLEFRYDDLYGRQGSSDVAGDRREAWDHFLDAINSVHDGKYNRDYERIDKKINNMKKIVNYRSTCPFVSSLYPCN